MNKSIIDTTIKEFHERFLTGTYMGDGEEMEAFLKKSLEEAIEKTREACRKEHEEEML